jgi:hypothetical protein
MNNGQKIPPPKKRETKRFVILGCFAQGQKPRGRGSFGTNIERTVWLFTLARKETKWLL